MSSDKTVAETPNQFWFENLPYFSILFKKEISQTSNEYR
jgi:hypothetical protein